MSKLEILQEANRDNYLSWLPDQDNQLLLVPEIAGHTENKIEIKPG